MARVLVIGQTPPPFQGQAIMIEHLVQGTFTHLHIEFIRLDYSATIGEIGQFSLRKVLQLLKLIVKVYRAALFGNFDYLYYPPAGPNKNPVLRDIAFLLSCRWLFKRTIFHFHASGISTLYPELSRPLRYLFRRAYFRPDLSIFLSTFNPRDDLFIHSLRSVEIPYGIPDHGRRSIVRQHSCPRILYVSALFRSKGILDLLAAASVLQRAGSDFRIDVVGGFESCEFEAECLAFLVNNALQDRIRFHGVRTGKQKWDYYEAADIFFFPSYYKSESFGIVLLEAMQFGLPLVATRWRGIQSIVREDDTGFLVPRAAPMRWPTSWRGCCMIMRCEERWQRARQRYETEYRLETWIERLERSITSLDPGANEPSGDPL